MFTHLHVHSHYSLLDGLAKIDALVAAALEHKMTALALTDHGSMYGAVEFYKKAKKAGIKPIIGCEVYVAFEKMGDKRPGIDHKRSHLVLLAKDKEGYQNLVKLATLAHLEGFYYKPRIDRDLLRLHSKGLIGLSACLGGEIPKALMSGNSEKAEKLAKEYQEIFGPENFYLEIGHHPNLKEQSRVNEEIIKLAKKINAPLVATNDVHYLKSEDAKAQDILLAVQTNTKVDDEDRLTMKQDDFSFRSPQVMEELFKHVPEAVAATEEIAGRCNLELELGKIKLPDFDVPDGTTPDAFLKKLAYAGLGKRYDISAENDPAGKNDFAEKIIARLEYELAIISKMGFASYFLIVQDFVNWAKNNGIVVGPGRGSAAGSIVSYLLNITNIDPIKYNLLFERFLNPDRISMPDIDLDFADTRRDEVLEYVAQKYGRGHVAQIITFGTMGARAAARDTGRALGLPYAFCDQVAKMIPFGMDFEEALATPDLKKFRETNAQAETLINSARKLEGVARHASTHACGVVITKEPLIDSVPLQKSTSGSDAKETVVTQYEMKAIEDLGLLKMDFLGLKNLTIIENAINLIEKRHGIKIQIDELPLDDGQTFKLLQKGDTTGVFQLESSGMKRYLKDLKPNEFEDIIAMVALYRPGPMELLPEFIERKHGRKKITYLYPSLEPILKNTYGIAVYQEQVMEIAKQLGGFTPGEADTLRKAIGKKIPELLAEQQKKLEIGCVKNGIKPQIAKALADLVEPFSRYGFNRSHAACYALLAYQTAYLKARYPLEFMTSLLIADSGDIERTAFLIQEAAEMGIKVLAPDINESFETFAPTGAELTVRFGLAAVKNVGENVVKVIISEREKNGIFKTITDLVSRVHSRDLNKKSLESLIKCGALDALGERKQILGGVEYLLDFAKSEQKTKQNGQFTMFDFDGGDVYKASAKLPQTEPATKKEKAAWEKELLGLYLTSHPLEEYGDKMKKYLTINAINEKMIGGKIKLGGMISQIKKIIAKNGKSMAFANLEDANGKRIELVIFPSTLEKTENSLKEDLIAEIAGKVDFRGGAFKIICDNIKEIK